MDTISSNYTAIKVSQSYARTLCQTGAPAYPVVEATIAGVHQVSRALIVQQHFQCGCLETKQSRKLSTR